ncbi:MAG: hypothetical protein CVU56_17900 [Deltaproteobacteria bacterium HGW-Deltaproteobacteria-14]|nr:MAG: hypothetical protein CVU56_17900 [Deltaproteobacteria bacterium HGW-Deltaproteobacteria-14]
MNTFYRVATLSVIASFALLACGDSGSDTILETLAVKTAPAGATAEAGTTLTAGGGALDVATVTTDDAGVATVTWTVGVAPIDNRLTFEADGGILGSATVRATMGVEPVPTAFGDVDAFLTGLDREGSTEGLAFAADDTLLIGVPRGLALIDADGTAHAVDPGGVGVAHPLGLAAASDGGMWVCDSEAGALVLVGADGIARSVVDHDGDDALETPNSVAIGPDGLVYFTDSCLGRLYQIDPATGAILSRVQTDLMTQGSPNGIAFDDAGRIWFTTENTGLLCGHADVELTAPLAGLFRVDIGSDGLGVPVAVQEHVGLFGDGLGFDAEGNLYAIFDTAIVLNLDESIVFVLPAGETTLTRFFGVKGSILANLAFGQGEYGETTLYFSLLSVVPFVPKEARGVVRLPIGVRGRL